MKSIAVIGAGIVGICTSFFLQKSGYKVTLFDQNEPGSVTSYGHACTFADYACVPVNSPSIYKELPLLLLKKDGPLAINYNYLIRNLPWVIQFLKNCRKDKVEYIASSLTQLLNHARLTYDQIFDEVDVLQYIKDVETLYLFKDEKDFFSAQNSIDLRKRNGIEMRELTSNEIKEIEPNIASIYYKGILFNGSRYTTNPLKISQNIFKTFISKGGLFKNKKVTSIQKNINQIIINCESFSYNYDQLVVCAGAWSKELALMVGDKFPLDTERGYHVLFNNINKLIDRPIGWSQSGFYIVQIEEGIRAAGTVELAGLNTQPNQKRLRMIEREARKLLPALGKVKSTWLGFRPTLPDSMPVIGQSEKDKNIFYAFGHQHIGWTLAAVTGKIIQYLVEGKKLSFDISPFNPNRFR
jgi:D-amino-acid dehydrogenase